jgi:hypothetical protein
MQGELVALEVPRGSGYDSQSGLNNLVPQVFGRLAADGCGKRVAFVVIHPTSNFMGHYLIGPLQRRGRAILALNTRYVANDSALIMERAIQDLGAGVTFLRQRGYQRIVLCGNSGRWLARGVLPGGGGVPHHHHHAGRRAVRAASRAASAGGRDGDARRAPRPRGNHGRVDRSRRDR